MHQPKYSPLDIAVSHINGWLRPLMTVAVLPVGLAAVGLAVSALPSHSQSETITTCEYDSSLGFEDPLNSGDSLAGSASLVVSEVFGNTSFTYQFTPPSPEAFAGGNIPFPNPTFSTQSSLNFFETPIAEARQQMLDNPSYYANLIGATVEGLRGRGYSEFDKTLTCRQEIATRWTPADGRPLIPMSGQFDALPDGNYRLTSADLPFRVVDTTELLESGGTVFLFKKVGSTVVGDFYYPETDSSVCIEGTLNADAVIGQASLDGTEATVPDSDALSILNQSTSGGASEAVLDLVEFSRINAGTVLPRESCE
ncbi:MAG: hypothetical protein AAFR58_19735 [Cyanobacteria bacterium J06627_28]